MKRQFITILLLLTAFFAKSQDRGISATFGVGSYNMADLKLYQDELISRLPVEARGLSYFPTYSNLRINYFKVTNRIKYGLVLAHNTTGAHANYSDPSGYLNLNQVVGVYQAGVSGSYRLVNVSGLELMAYGDFRLGYVRNEVTMSINTTYYFESTSQILSTVSPLLEGGLEVLYNFNNFAFGIEGGYLFDTGTKFKRGNLSSYGGTVSLAPGSDLKSELTGYRIGIKFLIWLSHDQFSELNERIY